MERLHLLPAEVEAVLELVSMETREADRNDLSAVELRARVWDVLVRQPLSFARSVHRVAGRLPETSQVQDVRGDDHTVQVTRIPSGLLLSDPPAGSFAPNPAVASGLHT